MLNNCEIRILGILMRTSLEFYSINQLSKQTKLAYPYVYNSVKNLEKKELISVRKIGKSNLCKIKFDHPEELAFSSLENRKQFLTKHLQINNLTKQLKDALADELYILLLFGSYVKGKAAKDSDIDLFFIIKNKNDLEKLKKKISSVINKLNYKIEFE